MFVCPVVPITLLTCVSLACNFRACWRPIKSKVRIFCNFTFFAFLSYLFSSSFSFSLSLSLSLSVHVVVCRAVLHWCHLTDVICPVIMVPYLLMNVVIGGCSLITFVLYVQFLLLRNRFSAGTRRFVTHYIALLDGWFGRFAVYNMLRGFVARIVPQ